MISKKLLFFTRCSMSEFFCQYFLENFFYINTLIVNKFEEKIQIQKKKLSIEIHSSDSVFIKY